jgi:four helix bundle protein
VDVSEGGELGDSMSEGGERLSGFLEVCEKQPPYGGVRSHRDLKVYQRAFALAMELFEVSTAFPADEKYSLTSQIRRSSRSICSNLAEAWRKRRYRQAFVAKLSDCEAEAGETQTWLEIAQACGYIDKPSADRLWQEYDALLSTLVGFIHHADEWTLKK